MKDPELVDDDNLDSLADEHLRRMGFLEYDNPEGDMKSMEFVAENYGRSRTTTPGEFMGRLLREEAATGYIERAVHALSDEKLEVLRAKVPVDIIEELKREWSEANLDSLIFFRNSKARFGLYGKASAVTTEAAIELSRRRAKSEIGELAQEQDRVGRRTAILFNEDDE